MLQPPDRALISLTQVLTKCRASGPVCALEALNIAGLYATDGNDIINIGSLIPGPPGPQGPPGPGCPEDLQQRLALIDTQLREIRQHLGME